MRKFSEAKACVLVPTYNNHKTISKVLEGILLFSEGGDVIVINDGSTDQTKNVLESFGSKIIVLDHFPNVGKGFSLRKGFDEAIRLGFEHAITIDSDGQHFPQDIPKFLDASMEEPNSLIMGARNMKQDDVPGKSSFGNKFSNFWFWLETGISLPDTQTGFRLYPLKPLSKISLFTTKFETEIEIIVKLAWRFVSVKSVEVKILYDYEDRISHFRPFKDFTRISILNTYLVVLTILFYLPRRAILKIFDKKTWVMVWNEFIKTDESNFSKSISIGFGVFIGIFPIWGFQLLVGIPLAILFRMNKALFVAAAHISFPPMIPVIIFLSYHTGKYFVEESIRLNSLVNVSLETIDMHIKQYYIGAVLFAIAAGILSFLLSIVLFSIFRKTAKPKNP